MSQYDELHAKVQTLTPLKLTFNQPQNGWWDGGAKQSGTFTFLLCTGGFEGKPNLSYHLEVGAWELNYYFRMAIPKNFNATRGIAKRMLRAKCHKPCTIA